MGFARFMSSAVGRLIRVVAGAVLIGVGLLVVQDTTTGIILAVIGAVPLIAGLSNFCVFAPLFGGPFLGSKVA